MANISETEKAEFKSKVSNYYPGDNCLWLRCCLHGIVPGGELASASIGIELFNIIHSQEGFETTVSILAEIAELTNVYEAKEYIKTFKANKNMNYSNVQRLTPYRKKLFKTLKQIGTSDSVGDDLKKIIGHYGVKQFNYTNIWDVVFRLERNTLLGDDPVKIQRFSDQLVGEAKDILKGESASASVEGTPFNVTSSSVDTVTSVTSASTTGLTSSSDKTDASNPTKQHLIFKELSEDKFREMLDHVSNWWKRFGNVNKLKVLLGEFDDIDDTDVAEGKKAVHMFKLLQARGLISESNIDVLIEAVKVCGMHGVRGKIEKCVPEFKEFSFDKVEYRIFSKDRQHLVKFGNTLNFETKERIVHLFNVDIDKEDQWVLIYKLEQMNQLTEDKKIKKAFIDRLMDIGLEKEAKALKY